MDDPLKSTRKEPIKSKKYLKLRLNSKIIDANEQEQALQQRNMYRSPTRIPKSPQKRMSEVK